MAKPSRKKAEEITSLSNDAALAVNSKVKLRERYTFFAAIAVFLVFLAVLRVHNALSFNPWWGYDGGGHLNYIFSIARNNVFPDLKQNYIAWHEPLYYIWQGINLKVLLIFTKLDPVLYKGMALAQVALSFGFTYLAYRIASLVATERKTIFFSFVAINLLPALTIASSFPTNELLNYVFILAIIALSYRHILHGQPTRRHYIIFGTVAGLGLLTKITAVIPIAISLAFLLWRAIAERNKKFVHGFGIIVAFIVILNIPWQLYRFKYIFDKPSINNYAFVEQRPLALDGRVDFYNRFDNDIFVAPYWYSGGRSFWSMLYADSFYDYYGVMENRDFLTQAPSSERVRTTHNNTYVSRVNYNRSKLVVWLALIPLAIILLGIVTMLFRARKSVRSRDARFASAVTFAFLSALIYYSYRYPYYDAGIVKSIFIFPAFIFPLAYGFEGLNIFFRGHAKYAYFILIPALGTYFWFLIPTLWVMKFNY